MEDQKQRVYDALNKMGIKYEVVEHEPVHTMEDMDRLGLPEKTAQPLARKSSMMRICSPGFRYFFDTTTWFFRLWVI